MADASRRTFLKLAGAATAAAAGGVPTTQAQTGWGLQTGSTPELTPGVRAEPGRIRDAEQAAARAVALAEEAGRRGTFAVGGLLVDDSGQVLAEARNAVIEDGQLSDPTAHVERQLVDWFAYAQRRGLAASARNATIVSSLDPCAMCAGAILRSGL